MTDDRKLHGKIAQVIAEVEEVEKKGHNNHFNYDYATAEDVLRVIRAPLAKLGVTVLPDLDRIEERTYTTKGGVESTITTAYIVYTFTDAETGETHACQWAGQGDDPVDKGWGKSATNAAKTFLRQAFLLPQGDDPEADASADARGAERASSRRQSNGAIKPSPKQGKMISDLGKQKNLQPVQIAEMAAELVGSPVEIKEGWVAQYLTGGRDGTASALIDRLMKGPYPEAPPTPPMPSSDVPADPSEFEHPAGPDDQFAPAQDAA